MTLGIAIYLCVAALAGTIVLYTVITGLTPVPTSRPVKSALLAALPAHVDGAVVELGSGWGTLAMALARRYPGCRVTGYELSPLPWLVSLVRGRLRGLSNLVLRRQDFYPVPLTDVSLAVCFLFPGGMERLKHKLEVELRPGALLVSNTHPVPGWEPTAIRHVDDQYATRIYLYQVPRREDQLGEGSRDALLAGTSAIVNHSS